MRDYDPLVSMVYVVFKFNSGDKKIEELYANDVISRQSIIKRDAKSLSLEGSGIYVLIEGSEKGIQRAREIAGEYEVKGEEASRIYELIKKSEDEASMGMGAIFG